MPDESILARQRLGASAQIIPMAATSRDSMDAMTYLDRSLDDGLLRQAANDAASTLRLSRLLLFSWAPRQAQARSVAVYGFAAGSPLFEPIALTDFPVADRCLRTGQILVMSAEAALPPTLVASFQDEIVIAPLMLGNRAAGFLVGQSSQEIAPRSASWQDQTRALAQRLAALVELHRVSVAYQEECSLRQSSREVANAILAACPLEDIAEQLIGIVSERLNEPRVALFLGDAKGLKRPLATRNISAEYGETVARLARRSPIVHRAIASDVPLHARNLRNEEQFSPELHALHERSKVTSILCAILRRGDQVKGVLAVYPETDRQFSAAELAVLQSVADQATIAVSIAEVLEQQRDTAMTEERNRLAREMHDTVAQSLTGLVLQIETVQMAFDSGDRNAAQEMLSETRAHAKKALEDTRRAVQNLLPASLERLSAAQAIAEEVRLLEANEGLLAQYVLTGEEQALLPEQSQALLRIAQEALNNARRHAQAARVRVGLQFGLESVVLIVEDDGIGFDLATRAAPDSEGGYGLFGMSERARLLHGELQVESTPGWGTRVRAMIPYRAEVPASVWGGRASVETGPNAAYEVASRIKPLPQTRAGGEAEKVRVLIVDDHAMVRQGVRAILEAGGGIGIVGEAEDGAQAVELAASLLPDVILMDLQMPGMTGMEALRQIHATLPDIAVVVLTTFQTEEIVLEALSAGARGFLLKDAEPADLMAAIRAAKRGEALLAPAVTDRLAALAAGQSERTPDAAERLNERELEVMQLLAKGARNKEIAAQLFVTASTVEYHLSHIFAKLEVSNRTEAVRVAMARGLVLHEPRSTK